METPFPNLAALREKLGGDQVVTRFAPSPTGYLHLGHVVNAIYVWGLARALGGEVILRLEDHDRNRCKPIYETAILEDLEWLGLHPDRGLPAEFRAGDSPYRQSSHPERYAAVWDRLWAQGQAYICDCSRKTIRARTAQPMGGEIRYDGFCRDRGLPPAPDRNWRVRLPRSSVAFEDARLGHQEQTPAEQCGDLMLRDRKSNWSYQFCVVVDDLHDGVNFVVRGEDILDSTGRQLLLADAIGQPLEAVFLHHGLLVDETGRKLSKRDFAEDIHARKLAGEDPERVLGEAAWRAGLIQKWRPLAANQLSEIFL